MQGKFLCTLTIVVLLVATLFSKVDACNRCGRNRCSCSQSTGSGGYESLPIPLSASLPIPLSASLPIPVPASLPIPLSGPLPIPIPDSQSINLEYLSNGGDYNICCGCGGPYDGPICLPKCYCRQCQRRKLARLNNNCC